MSHTEDNNFPFIIAPRVCTLSIISLAMRMIGVSVHFSVSRAIEPTYQWVVHEETPIKMVRKWGILPGFQDYRLMSDDWAHEQANRRVTLTDGNQLTETIKTLKPFSYFDYELTDFTAPLMKLLLRRGRGQWWLDPAGKRTNALWRYSFEPAHPLAVPLVWLFMKFLYKPYMHAAIRNMQRILK